MLEASLVVAYVFSLVIAKYCIVSFLPKILGRNRDFPKGSVCGGSHFSKYLGRNGFRVEFEFSDFFLGGGESDF